ncbi:MAG: hypothetical protein ACHQEM_07220 [Chitinophagales bacterium]
MRVFLIFVHVVWMLDSAIGQSSINNQIIQNTFQEFSAASGNKTYTGAGVPVFNHLEDTHGTRYLFDKWVHGTILNANGELIANDSFFLNYDKISESLFLTIDKQTIVEIAKKEVRAFTLKYGDQEYKFERVYLIDNKNLFQVLIRDSIGFSLYKLYHTKFRKADYTNDGIHESGHNYNEFVDQPDYFVLYPDREVVHIDVLTRKAIGKAFNLNVIHDKVVSYLSQHEKDPEDEQLLRNLVLYLNQ